MSLVILMRSSWRCGTKGTAEGAGSDKVKKGVGSKVEVRAGGSLGRGNRRFEPCDQQRGLASDAEEEKEKKRWGFYANGGSD